MDYLILIYAKCIMCRRKRYKRLFKNQSCLASREEEKKYSQLKTMETIMIKMCSIEHDYDDDGYKAVERNLNKTIFNLN